MHDSLKNPLFIGFSGIVYQSIMFLKDRDIYVYIYLCFYICKYNVFVFIYIDNKTSIYFIYTYKFMIDMIDMIDIYINILYIKDFKVYHKSIISLSVYLLCFS